MVQRTRLALAAAVAMTVAASLATAQQDPYEQYVKTSKDFQPVKQDKDWCYKAWPSWTYMPWTYQWTIGYTEASGKWSLANGYNGAFLDHGNPAGEKLGWINQFKLHFYNDHTAGKGYLHLGSEKMKDQKYRDALHGTGMRTRPLNAEMKSTLEGLIKKSVDNLKSSPYRSAYALDDEIAWGHFVHPTMWQVTDDKEAYPKWLREVYGADAPKGDKWIGYNDLLPRLGKWTVADFDASPLLDQWTFNDSYWNNYLGDLAEYGNRLDADTPVGFVGGQSPNAFGGFDYAKVMRKVQFIESYNIGGSQAVIRSFNPHNALPTVTTHFHKDAADTIWQVHYYLAHGNRGMIGWVEKWFTGKPDIKPEMSADEKLAAINKVAQPWVKAVAPTYLEANEKLGPLMAKAEWIHDGVAIYYSHASIQLGWIMDAEAHGTTWINRNDDARLGGSHLLRHAWENMLRDSGLQYSFLSYVDVVQKGVPAEYKVLILTGAMCLSDAEARRIKEFVENGGTVIADYLPGVWDQHGKGRANGGALDELFGVKHDPKMTAADVFNGKRPGKPETLWCEADQDANFGYKAYTDLLTKANTCIKDESGFNKAVRKMDVAKVNKVGKGTAVLMNLSPQWYNAYRVEGFAAAKKRATFMKHVTAAGLKPWVQLKGAGDKEFGHEISYWQKDGRTIVCLVFNPEVRGTELGGGNAAGLKTASVPVTVAFAKAIKGVKDERAGKDLPAGQEFKFDWKMNESVVLSFEGAPPKN